MRSILRLVSVTTLAAALAAVPGSAQKTTGPKERYEMDVATASGFAAMAAGGKPGLGSAMSMMFGGGPEGKVAHTLELRLGSNQGPTSPPVRGDHIFEPQAKLGRSEEHTSELQSLMRISYAVFCLKKKNLKYRT